MKWIFLSVCLYIHGCWNRCYKQPAAQPDAPEQPVEDPNLAFEGHTFYVTTYPSLEQFMELANCWKNQQFNVHSQALVDFISHKSTVSSYLSVDHPFGIVEDDDGEFVFVTARSGKVCMISDLRIPFPVSRDQNATYVDCANDLYKLKKIYVQNATITSDPQEAKAYLKNLFDGYLKVQEILDGYEFRYLHQASQPWAGTLKEWEPDEYLYVKNILTEPRNDPHGTYRWTRFSDFDKILLCIGFRTNIQLSIARKKDNGELSLLIRTKTGVKMVKSLGNIVPGEFKSSTSLPEKYFTIHLSQVQCTANYIEAVEYCKTLLDANTIPIEYIQGKSLIIIRSPDGAITDAGVTGVYGNEINTTCYNRDPDSPWIRTFYLVAMDGEVDCFNVDNDTYNGSFVINQHSRVPFDSPKCDLLRMHGVAKIEESQATWCKADLANLGANREFGHEALQRGDVILIKKPNSNPVLAVYLNSRYAQYIGMDGALSKNPVEVVEN